MRGLLLEWRSASRVGSYVQRSHLNIFYELIFQIQANVQLIEAHSERQKERIKFN